MRPGFWRLVLLFLITYSSSVLADDVLEKAGKLIDSHRGAEAYALLLPLVEARAGNPDFDLLLGIAAVDAGKPTEAVFALERVLAVQPDNARARLELGRAYYDAGENEASREEFKSVRGEKLPDDVSQTIEKYLSSIDARINGQKRQVNFYLQGTLGYDSNVNAATDTSQVAIPAFGNLVFTLDNSARELDSGFYRIEGGGSFSTVVPGHDSLRMFGAADAYYRPTWNQPHFDTGAGEGQVGMAWAHGNDTFTGSVVGQSYLIDGDINRNQAGLFTQWLHMHDQNTQLSLFAQGLVQRFPNQQVRDVTQYAGGAGIVHLFDGASQPIAYASVFGGADVERDNTRPDIGRTFVGLRAGGQYTLMKDLNLVGGLSYQHSHYGGTDPLFLTRRKDDFFFAHAGLEYTLGGHWMFLPEIQYIRNDSTIVINDFTRWQAFMSVRYNF